MPALADEDRRQKVYREKKKNLLKQPTRTVLWFAAERPNLREQLECSFRFTVDVRQIMERLRGSTTFTCLC